MKDDNPYMSMNVSNKQSGGEQSQEQGSDPLQDDKIPF